MKKLIAITLVILTLSLGVDYGYTLGDAEGGHTADCPSPTGGKYYHRNEYVTDGDDTEQDGDEYWGSLWYHVYLEQHCPGQTGIKITVTADQKIVTVGTWEGEASLKGSITLPMGYTIEGDGTVKKGGSTTETMNITAEMGCPENLTAEIYHRVVIGTGLTDRTVTQKMKHVCHQWNNWLGPHWDWNCFGNEVYATHTNAYTKTGQLTWLSSGLKNHTHCGALLSEKTACPIPDCED